MEAIAGRVGARAEGWDVIEGAAQCADVSPAGAEASPTFCPVEIPPRCDTPKRRPPGRRPDAKLAIQV